MRKLALLAAVLLTCSCRSRHQTESKPLVLQWRPMGSWSGHGDTQTESFEIGYTQIRLRWVTKNESPAGQGTFHVTVNSAVSGRELADAITRHGTNHGVAYVSVDPHYSYLLIESANLDWWITVEEPYVSEAKTPEKS
jgi:hypothetical protein